MIIWKGKGRLKSNPQFISWKERNMRKTLGFVWFTWKDVLIVSAILGIALWCVPAEATILSFDDGQRHYSADTWFYDNGQVSLSAGFSTKIGMVDDVQLSYYPSGDNSITVNTWVMGKANLPAPLTKNVNQHLSVSSPTGRNVSESVYTSWYTVNPNDNGKGEAPLDGDVVAAATLPNEYWANGGMNLIFDAPDLLNVSANANFFQVYNSFDGITHTYFTPDWNITFNSAKGAADFAEALSGVATEVPAPEPSIGMMVLAFAPIAYLFKRRRPVACAD